MKLEHVIMSQPYPPDSGFLGYGLASDAKTQEAVNARMDNIINALQRAITALRVKATIDLTVDSEQRRSTSSSMASFEQILARLSGPSREEVLAGTLSLEKWVDTAMVVQEGLAAQAVQFGEGSLLAEVGRLIQDSAQDLRDLGSGVASVGTGLSVGVIVGGLAVAGLAAYLYFVSGSRPAAREQPKLSGLVRRRSRRAKRKIRKALRVWEPEDALAGSKR